MASFSDQIFIDEDYLSEAFPTDLTTEAYLASRVAARMLCERQHSRDRFSVSVAGEAIWIPRRLYFQAVGAVLPVNTFAGTMLRSLQTRSNDGFERQRAARDVLGNIQIWSIPFIVALMGEYVHEILLDIEAAMAPALLDGLVGFVTENHAYWETTKRRVMSYWSAHHRHVYPRSDYVGFRLIEYIEAEVLRVTRS